NAVVVPIALVAIIGSPAGGFLADFWFKKNPRGRIYLPVITNVLATVFLVAALFLQLKGPLGMAFIIIYGLLFVMAVPCIMAIIQDVAPAAQKGTAWGAIILGYYGIGGWSPYIVGAISDALGQDAQALGTALTIAGMGAVLGAICFIIASKSYIADMDKIKHEQVMAEK
ncbi:MAG: MFS transporter, partial [Dehalococcoidia bacterium]